MPLPTIRRGVVRLGALAVIAVGAPLAFSPTKGVTVNDACADPPLTGTCCSDQSTNWCNAGDKDHQGYYYKATGPCP